MIDQTTADVASRLGVCLCTTCDACGSSGGICPVCGLCWGGTCKHPTVEEHEAMCAFRCRGWGTYDPEQKDKPR